MNAARAQQMQVGSPGNFPQGITVVVSGSATATRTVDVYTAIPEKNATYEHLRSVIKLMGIIPLHMMYANGSSSITVPSTKGHDVRIALKKAGWSTSTLEILPENPVETRRLALEDAITNARLTASILAKADGRTVGKILNIEPSPSDYAREAMGLVRQMSPFALIGTESGPTIIESEIVTFELLP